MRQHVKYKVLYAGAFKRSRETMDLAVEFANSLEPNQLISINTTEHGKVIVWYRDK
jgi:hypothetical protein